MTFFLASSRDLGIGRACRRVTGLYSEEYFKTQKADFSANEILLMFLGCTNNLEAHSHIDSYPLCMDSTLISKSLGKANRNSS